jgi:hypothetical protein
MFDIQIEDPRIRINIRAAIRLFDQKAYTPEEMAKFVENFKKENGQEGCDELTRCYKQHVFSMLSD